MDDKEMIDKMMITVMGLVKITDQLVKDMTQAFVKLQELQLRVTSMNLTFEQLLGISHDKYGYDEKGNWRAKA